jgi:hypothetical protein
VQVQVHVCVPEILEKQVPVRCSDRRQDSPLLTNRSGQPDRLRCTFHLMHKGARPGLHGGERRVVVAQLMSSRKRLVLAMG